MTGNIITCEQALEQYGGQYKSIRRVEGGLIELRNSEGRLVRLRPNTRVYHRGHGKFSNYSILTDARYSRARKMRTGQEHGQKPPKGRRANQGDTRHLKDGGYV